MGLFILRRIGVMLLTALTLTVIVFTLTNLQPNLEKVAKFQGNARMTDEEVAGWLEKNGYAQPMLKRYGEWLGVSKGWTYTDDNGRTTGRCIGPTDDPQDAPARCGLLQGNWGQSIVFREKVGNIVGEKLGLTGKLMFWVMLLMVPLALIVGV
ncbi:MAG: ABC transporter permease, partial [Marinibacterium sp.]